MLRILNESGTEIRVLDNLHYIDKDRIKTIRIGNLNLSGVETRTLLGLRSANFTVEITEKEILFKSMLK